MATESRYVGTTEIGGRAPAPGGTTPPRGRGAPAPSGRARGGGGGGGGRWGAPAPPPAAPRRARRPPPPAPPAGPALRAPAPPPVPGPPPRAGDPRLVVEREDALADRHAGAPPIALELPPVRVHLDAGDEAVVHPRPQR